MTSFFIKTYVAKPKNIHNAQTTITVFYWEPHIHTTADSPCRTKSREKMDKCKEYVICKKMRQTHFCEYLRQDPYGRDIKTAVSSTQSKKDPKDREEQCIPPLRRG